MGLDSIWHWIILLVIVLAVFGAGKLTRMGPDLGNAVRGFKKALQGEDEDEAARKKSEDKLHADPADPADTTTQQAQRDSSESK